MQELNLDRRTNNVLEGTEATDEANLGGSDWRTVADESPNQKEYFHVFNRSSCVDCLLFLFDCFSTRRCCLFSVLS